MAECKCLLNQLPSYYSYTLLLPLINESKNNTIKIKKSTLAIVADVSARNPKPNIAATIATIKKITAQRNIVLDFIVK